MYIQWCQDKALFLIIYRYINENVLILIDLKGKYFVLNQTPLLSLNLHFDNVLF